MTALYEAFCLSVDETGKKLAALPEALRPEKILFVVLTDGGENHSDIRKYSLEAVKSRLSHQRDVYGWDFSFLGADFDVAKETKTMGVASVHNYSYDKTATRSALDNMSKSVTQYRGASLQSKKNLAEYMVEQDDAAKVQA